MNNIDDIILKRQPSQSAEKVKVLTIIGARPQFIKSAMLSLVFKDHTQFDEVLVHTGQHFDANMSQVFFDDFQMTQPKYCLDIKSECSVEAVAQMQSGIEEVIEKERPNLVVVFGDTNSTLAAARAARSVGVKVAHIEAGMRSFEAEMPEEKIRIETDRLSDYFFCASQKAVENLQNEGIGNPDTIFFVGDLMRDASHYFVQNEKMVALESGLVVPDNYVLCTIHRADNVDNIENLSGIVAGINQIHAEVPVLFPIHPRTRLQIEKFGLTLKAQVINPVGFFEMMTLLKNSKSVLTDSGGLQKEAYFFEKKCIVLRNTTEWTELVELGHNVLSQANAAEMFNQFRTHSSDSFVPAGQLYGNGNAAKKILSSFQKLFNFAHA